MRRARAYVPLVALLALLAALPGAVAAQEAKAPELAPLTKGLLLAWTRGDAGDVADLIAATGVAINVDGQANGPLAKRQASATLRRLFADAETVTLTIASKRVLPVKPPRAYLELQWTRRLRGTTIPDHRTIFVALVGEGDEWRITEIRLFQ